MLSTKSITRTTVLLTFVLLLSTIALPQGLDSRSFDTLPRRNSVGKSEGIPTNSRAAAQPVCPVYGKPLTTMNTDYANIQFSVGMGSLADGTQIRPLKLYLSELTAESYTPAALSDAVWDGVSPEIEVIKTPPAGFGALGFLRQVKTPETFVDIVTLSNWEFEARFYYSGNAGPIVNGLHTVVGVPFVIWRVKNPNPPATNRIQIIKVENGFADKSEFIYDAAADHWSMINNEGETTSFKTSEINPEDPCERTEILVEQKSGSCLCKRTRVYRGFAWGQEIVKETQESDGESRTTTYAYYTNPAEQDRYRHLQTITFPDGSWETYDYKYELKGLFGSLIKNVVASGGRGDTKPR
jgi:hypothetical protein